jgi:hypothetical protein
MTFQQVHTLRNVDLEAWFSSACSKQWFMGRVSVSKMSDGALSSLVSALNSNVDRYVIIGKL